jgi:hypothetical protein
MAAVARRAGFASDLHGWNITRSVLFRPDEDYARSPDLMATIKSAVRGRIAITYFEWAEAGIQHSRTLDYY